MLVYTRKSNLASELPYQGILVHRFLGNGERLLVENCQRIRRLPTPGTCQKHDWSSWVRKPFVWFRTVLMCRLLCKSSTLDGRLCRKFVSQRRRALSLLRKLKASKRCPLCKKVHPEAYTAFFPNRVGIVSSLLIHRMTLTKNFLQVKQLMERILDTNPYITVILWYSLMLKIAQVEVSIH